MSQRSMAWPMVSACTVGQSRLIRPPRSSSPRMRMMPPARWTSSMCTSCLAGATLDRQGTLRDRRSISSMVKSIPPSWAAARMCSTVLVEPPMAMSSAMAFSKAALEAMLRGSNALVVLLVVAAGDVDDEVAGLDEEALAVGMGGERRAVAGQRQAKCLGQAVHRVGGEHARAGAAGRAGGASRSHRHRRRKSCRRRRRPWRRRGRARPCDPGAAPCRLPSGHRRRRPPGC